MSKFPFKFTLFKILNISIGMFVLTLRTRLFAQDFLMSQLRHKPVLFINLQGNKGPIPPRPISLRINSYGDNGDWVPDSFKEK